MIVKRDRDRLQALTAASSSRSAEERLVALRDLRDLAARLLREEVTKEIQRGRPNGVIAQWLGVPYQAVSQMVGRVTGRAKRRTVPIDGTILFNARVRHQLSTEALAARAGVSPSLIERAERLGMSSSFEDNVERLEAALRTQLS